MIIYKCTNKINGKSYIGQTSRPLYKRIYEHLYKETYYFSNALKKYGMENFKWSILEKCNTKNELNEMEFHFIKQYKSHVTEKGYNLTWGGDGGNCGNQFTKLPKKERSDIHFLNKMSVDEHDKFVEKYCVGENHYTKRCMSEKEYNEWLKKYRIGKNNPMYGKKRILTDETKSKMSLSHIGKIIPEETKVKMRKVKMGKNNPMSRTYKLYEKDGSYKIIKGILNYCRENNTTVYKLRKKYKICEITGGK